MFSDALDREAAFLNTTTDGLPNLTALFQIIQARQPRMPATRKKALYVLRAPSMSAKLQRYGGQRSMLTTHLMLRLYWPLSNGQGSAETEQLAFEQAIDQVITRVQGPFGDKTHGGRFLSVAENPDYIDVDYGDPEKSIADGVFAAHLTYAAEDPDFNN